MSEPNDNIPQEWYRPVRGRLLREMLSENHYRRQMTDFAKFVVVHAMDMNDTLEPDEMLDAWMEQTYNKPKVALEEIAATYVGYKERPSSTSEEISVPTMDYLPECSPVLRLRSGRNTLAIPGSHKPE